MVYYRPDSSGIYEFAFALSFLNSSAGKQYVPFNTFQPSFAAAEQSNSVANWIQLTNSTSFLQTGDLYYYSMDGLLMNIQKAVLAPGARQDFAGHQFGPNLVGIVEWRPDDPSAKFQLRNVRYYYGVPLFSANVFATASQFDAQYGNGEEITAPLDSSVGSAILEIANVSQQSNLVSINIYNQAGALLDSQSLSLAPYASYHLISDPILNGQKGNAVISSSVPSGLIATAMHYGRDTTGSLLYMYGVQAQQALGSVLQGSYNTFLNQSCELQLANATASQQSVNIRMTRYDGTPVLGAGIDTLIPPFALLAFDLCSQDIADVYGVVTVQPQNPNSVSGSIIRVAPGDQYRFPTKLAQ
jgi:hypothetical protein